MNTKAIILTGITAMLYVKGLSQINYGIAALDRSDITCTNLAATDKSPQIPVYETVQTESTGQQETQKEVEKEKGKNKISKPDNRFRKKDKRLLRPQRSAA